VLSVLLVRCTLTKACRPITYLVPWHVYCANSTVFIAAVLSQPNRQQFARQPFSLGIQHYKVLTYLLIYSIEQSPSWEANRFVASQEIPRIVWKPKVLTAFTITRHLFLFWANSIQSIPPHPTTWRSILILSYHLRLGLPTLQGKSAKISHMTLPFCFFHIFETERYNNQIDYFYYKFLKISKQFSCY
jgi:hypothetical protein